MSAVSIRPGPEYPQLSKCRLSTWRTGCSWQYIYTCLVAASLIDFVSKNNIYFHIPHNMKLPASLTLLVQALAVFGADTTSWKSRTIYFALTDRIARDANDNGGGSCGNLGDYCGGTFKGLQGKLDYIRGMGFDAIWITPVIESMFSEFFLFPTTQLTMDRQ